MTTTVGSGLLVTQEFCGDPCSPTSFCETTPNSVGNGARMGFNGTTSYLSNNLDLFATGVPPGKLGLFFYGPQPTNKPFGNGVLCVGGSKKRLPIETASAIGTLSHDLDLTQPGAASISVGETWYFQAWYRDPQGGGNGTNLSDGLTTVWCP